MRASRSGIQKTQAHKITNKSTERLSVVRQRERSLSKDNTLGIKGKGISVSEIKSKAHNLESDTERVERLWKSPRVQDFVSLKLFKLKG